MQAGVVAKKGCRLHYQCAACRYDRALRRVAEENRRAREQGRPMMGKRAKIVSWKERLRELPPAKRPCLHHMKQRIAFRACTNHYSCADCEFGQFFDDQFTVHTTLAPVELLDIEGFKVPQGYYLHRGHTWAKIEAADTVRVGIDQFAWRLLGPFDRIEAPLLGKTLEQGRPDIELQRGEHSARMLSPVSGVITATNTPLSEREAVADQNAYTEGWVVRVHTDRLRQDLAALMIGKETTGFFVDEIQQLFTVIEDTVGPLAVDGGKLGSNIYGNMPELGWERLTQRFLHT
jgi:glycine cleavage system H lipoate-binding protein